MKYTEMRKDQQNQTMEATEVAKKIDQIAGGRPHFRPRAYPRTKK